MNMPDRHRTGMRARLLTAAACIAALSFLGACAGDSTDQCRLDPESCGGGRAGAFCDNDGDCRDVCCTDDSNCAGGTCTFVCANDDECPVDMACEHDVCFYRCNVDEDCALGQSCEHGNTICEWP